MELEDSLSNALLPFKLTWAAAPIPSHGGFSPSVLADWTRLEARSENSVLNFCKKKVT